MGNTFLSFSSGRKSKLVSSRNTLLCQIKVVSGTVMLLSNFNLTNNRTGSNKHSASNFYISLINVEQNNYVVEKNNLKTRKFTVPNNHFTSGVREIERSNLLAFVFGIQE